MGSRAAVGVIAALLALPASAYGQAPSNDNYLESLGFNAPGQRLPRGVALRTTTDTTNATVQSDVFNPPRSGGPAELTTCDGAGYGRTVWYDIYPDVNGAAQIRASGYDSAIAVVPFDRRTGQPDFGAAQCANVSSSTTEAFIAEVRGGRAYSIQVGAVNDVGGPLELLFEFLADSDGDRVYDAVDRCDLIPGTAGNNGCPRTQKIATTLRATPTADGIRIVGLSVRARRGSRVVVSCSSGCRRQVKRARSTVGFPGLAGVSLRAGARLDIRVTRPGFFGELVRYTILRGNFKKIERCMNPGSRVLRRRCG